MGEDNYFDVYIFFMSALWLFELKMCFSFNETLDYFGRYSPQQFF